MDDYLKREREKLDQLSKEALEQLILKDEIINELKSQLEIEQNENNNLKKKCNDLETRLMSIEVEDYPNNNKLNFSNVFEASRLDKVQPTATATATTSNQDYLKLVEEKSGLEAKLTSLLNEFNNLKEKSKNLLEIENLYKQQLEAQRKRIERFEAIEQEAKEKDKYIDDLSERYRYLENDYEQIIINKEVEIKELRSELRILADNNEMLSLQVNQSNQNSNNITHDYIKEMRMLDEHNKELEVELYKRDLQYQEEIKKLQRLVDNNRVDIHHSQSHNDIDVIRATKDSQIGKSKLNVEDLALSVSKSIRDKIDSQNKKLSSQNVEIISLQYEVEKLSGDLKYEKEMKEKLQQTLADVKFRNMSTSGNNCEKEDAAVQTNMKMDDIETNKSRLKTVEDSLSKTSDNLEKNQKEFKLISEKNTKLAKELREKEEEIKLFVKKVEKMKSKENISNYIDKDLCNMNNISKLNATISNLKLRQSELLEKIQYLESGNKGYPRKPEIAGSLSFNLTEESGVNKSQRDNVNNRNSLEHELIKLQEDNYFLKEENFKLMSDLSRLNDTVASLKGTVNNLTNDKQDLLSAKDDAVMHYEHVVATLTNELDTAKHMTNEKIDEMRHELANFSDMNNQLKEQFISLQNRFYVQSQLIQEKNNEILEEKNISEELNRENMNLISELDKKVDLVNKLEKDCEILKKEYEKFRYEYIDTKRNLDSLDSASRQMEQKELTFRTENESLKEMNNKLKHKLKELYDEIKSKDGKLVNLLKEENKELESRLRSDISELRNENENLMKERSMLRLNNNELKHEITMLKEQINSKQPYSDKSTSGSIHYKESRKGGNYEAEQIKGLREENIKIKKDTEELLNKLNQKENIIKTTQLDLQTINNEKLKLSDLIGTKEKEIKQYKDEIDNLHDAIKKIDNYSDKIQKLLDEISSKNKTINYLIEEVDACKKEAKENQHQNEIILIKLKDDNDNLNIKLRNVEGDFEKYKQSAENTISDLQKENDILINDLEEKEKAFESTLMDRNNLEQNLERQNKTNEDIYEKISANYKATLDENKELKNKLEDCANASVEKFNSLTEKVIKSKTKVDNLVNTYDSYIKYLKERFQLYIDEITLFMNNMNNSDKLTRVIKNLENLTDLTAKLAETEAMIENFKNEIKGLKTNICKASENIKRLTKENEEMNLTINQKKLQLKYKKLPTSRLEVLSKLIDYENQVKQNSEMKIREGDFKGSLLFNFS
jgi:chromosome segregation ATPase